MLVDVLAIICLFFNQNRHAGRALDHGLFLGNDSCQLFVVLVMRSTADIVIWLILFALVRHEISEDSLPQILNRSWLGVSTDLCVDLLFERQLWTLVSILVSTTLFPQSHQHGMALSFVEEELFDALRCSKHLRVDDVLAVLAEVHHVFEALASLGAKFAHLVKLQDHKVARLAFALEAVNHFLEIRVAHFEDDFLVNDVQFPVLFAFALNSVVERQFEHFVKCLGVLDALLTALERLLMVPFEQLVHEGIQRVVEVVVLQIVIRGDLK